MFDNIPNDVIELPLSPTIEVLSVKLRDSEDVIHDLEFVADVDSEPARLKIKSYPNVKLAEFGALRILYKTGYDEIPKQTGQAILMLVNNFYDDREAMNKEIPGAVKNLLRPNRMW